MFTEYSLWFLPLIGVIAGVIVYLAYFFRSGKNTIFNKKQTLLLCVLRFAGVFLLLFLLLSPIKRITRKTIEKPTVILLQDNSSSLIATAKAGYYKDKYLKDLLTLKKNLAKDYNTVMLTFGADTKQSDSVTFSDSATDIAQAMEYIGENFSSENLSAVILCSDAITTGGDNFINYSDKLTYPVYTVAMGDTAIRKDLSIANIQYNKIAFLNSEYPIEVTVKADKSMNEKSTLFMVKDGKTTQIKDFSVNADDYSFTTELRTTATKPGIEKISFYVKEINGEINTANNRKDIFIEVIDAKKSILILADAPHPDISALKTVLENSNNYTVSVLINDYGHKNFSEYDLIILHGLPDNTISYNTIKKLLSENKNLLFIIAKRTDSQLFNSLNTGITISELSKSSDQSYAIYNPSFTLFNLEGQTTDILAKMPPLLTKSAKYNTNGNVQCLLYQKIGAVSTSYPLVAFVNNGLSKTGFILGENIWRWKLQNFLINGNSSFEIDGFINKTVHYLSDKTDKKRFRTEHKDIYNQNENIIFTAQFYNESFELINTPDVSLQITDGKKNYSYTFGKSNNGYYINMGNFPQGEYGFVAKTVYGGKEYIDKGHFVVSANDMELADLVAKHSDLYTLSAKTNAAMLYPENILDLEKMIKQNDNIKPIIHVNIENRKFISLWWYWLAIILTLGGEWFLRKYFGKI